MRKHWQGFVVVSVLAFSLSLVVPSQTHSVLARATTAASPLRVAMDELHGEIRLWPESVFRGAGVVSLGNTGVKRDECF